MDEKHRSLFDTPNDMPNAETTRSLIRGKITDDVRYKFERIYSDLLEKKGTTDDILKVEEELKEIRAHEEYIRTLRQGYENKLRSFKLSEAITTSRRL